MSVEFIPAFQPIINRMRKKGVELKPESVLYIDTLITYILNFKLLNNKEIAELHKAIADYLIKHKDKTYEEMVKKSKTLRGKVKWEEVDSIYQNQLKEWEQLMIDICNAEEW